MSLTELDISEEAIERFLAADDGEPVVLVNLVRMTIVCLVAADFGFWPAVLVHDYGGTLIIVAWLFAFWAFVHRWILGDLRSDEIEVAA